MTAEPTSTLSVRLSTILSSTGSSQSYRALSTLLLTWRTSIATLGLPLKLPIRNSLLRGFKSTFWISLALRTSARTL
jgi:hypothetical protein